MAWGAAYLVGGLVVNLPLSRYGVTEYQILRVKYLVVGLTYLTNYLASLLLAVIPAFLLATADLIAPQFVLIASLIASLFLLWFWGGRGATASPTSWFRGGFGF